VFCYTLAREGVEMDDFASNPEYFHDAPLAVRQRARGEPARIAHLLSAEFAADDLDAWFRSRGDREPEALMERFHQLLGIGLALTSYDDLERGERDGVAQWSRFIHLPDLAAEKAAHKAQLDAIGAAKRALVRRGCLLFDSTLQRGRNAWQDVMIHGPHPDGGFLCSHFRGVPRLMHWRPPDWACLEKMDINSGGFDVVFRCLVFEGHR
jgi:hypothetical protein